MAKKTSTKKKKVTLRYHGESGREVLVAGSFNDWTLEEAGKGSKVKQLKEDDKTGSYTINMFLPLGTYEYKFYCEGRWFVDNNAEEQIPNGLGSFNSVLKVA